MLSPQEFKLESLLALHEGATPDHWKEKYLHILDEVKPGLNELIVHLGYDDLKFQAITTGYNHHDATWPQRDLDAVRSAEFKEALRRNHIVLTTWREVAGVQ